MGSTGPPDPNIVPDKMSTSNIPEMSDRMAKKMSDNVSDYMSEYVSELMSNRMTDRISDLMSDKNRYSRSNGRQNVGTIYCRVRKHAR